MNRIFYLCGIVLLVSFVGCSGGLSVNYVEGTVKHDGSPVEGASVTFTPKSDGKGMIASGITDANGVYKLTVVQGGKKDKGAMEGDYTVSIIKKTDFPIRMDPPPPAYPDSAEIPIYGFVFPKKYTNPNTSGLTASVKSGKNLNVDFELTGPGDQPMKK